MIEISERNTWDGLVWWDGKRWRRLTFAYVREPKHWPEAFRARPLPRYRSTAADLSLWWGPFGLVWYRSC